MPGTAARPLAPDVKVREVWAWSMYDFANSAYTTVVITAVVGGLLGLLAGFVERWPSTVLMRLADVQLSFPSILIALMIFGIARGFIAPANREEMAIWVLIVSLGRLMHFEPDEALGRDRSRPALGRLRSWWTAR